MLAAWEEGLWGVWLRAILGHLSGVAQASGEQPKTVTFDDAWTTAGSGMRSHPQLQSAQPLSLNIKEGGGTVVPPP